MLDYELTHGQHRKKNELESARRLKAGLPPLEHVENVPLLQHHLENVWLAFVSLGSCRASGMGAAPIPWTAINEWCKRYGYSLEEQERYVTLLGAMDSVYLSHANKKA